LFRGTPEGIENFSTFGESAFGLLVLLTTANFPDFMLPAYQVSRLNCIFFISFLIFGLFLLMNLLLAIFYSNYQLRFQQQINSFVEERNNYLIEKFTELDKNGKGYLSKDECYLIFQDIRSLDQSIMDQDIQQVQPEHFEHMYTLIDESGDGKIHLDEFIKIFEVFELYKYETGKKSLFTDSGQKVSSELSRETLKERMKSVIESIQYEFIVNVISVVNILALTIREATPNDATGFIDFWCVAQIIINTGFLVELILEMYAFGIAATYSHSFRATSETLA